MKKGFYIGFCYSCHQGNVYICKTTASGKQFLICEECDAEWASPEDFQKKNMSKQSDDGPYEPLAKDEIIDHKWKSFVLNKKELEN